MSAVQQSRQFCKLPFFIIRSGLLAEIRWSECMSNPMGVYMCHFLGAGLCIYYLLVILIYSLKFFTSALSDGLSQVFGWQQVTSSPQDSSQYTKSTILQVFFFLLIINRSGLLAEIRWSVSMSKSHRSLCVLFSRTDAGLCIYRLFVWSN